ncbi:MAG: hypothetical protein J0H49_15655 [Acidobacteria bacterium]|nr:hypothetical protein [Acidobacteriota bacterium]
MIRATKKDLARSRVLRDSLGALGYPGFVNLFTEMEAEFEHDPAVVLIAALSCENLDDRVVEALPWLILRYNDLDWDWIKKEARQRQAQNRLGFIVSLALRVGASTYGNTEKLLKLSAIEEDLFEYRLDKEDTLCRKLPQGERQWIREARSTEARQWNLLTDLRAQDLSYNGDI